MPMANEYLQKAGDDTWLNPTGTSWVDVEHKLGREFFTKHGYDGALTVEDKVGNVQMFNPSAIRNPHAKFDPAKKNSTNLLASLLAGIGLSKTNKEEQQ
jgi:hypothetical protein